jgi:hypothetical protein
MKFLEEYHSNCIPINHPNLSGSIQEGASVVLPVLIEMMFTHPLHGNTRVLALLVLADTCEADGISHRLGHFERMWTYNSRQSSRALFLHRIVLVEPLSSPLVLWCDEWFSSFNASAKTLGNYMEGGWAAWHVLKYPQLTMAVVMKEAGLLNHDLLVNERVSLSRAYQHDEDICRSCSLRDAMANECKSECDEASCYIPDKKMYSENQLNTPKRVALFAEGCYECYKGNAPHSFISSRWEGDYATEETCFLNKMDYRLPVLKPRPIPKELQWCEPGKRSTDAEKRRYEKICFASKYQYTPSSTADFTEPPNALRLAIRFEQAERFVPGAYFVSFKEYVKTPACVLNKVMNSVPGFVFAEQSRWIASPQELHQLLQTWEFFWARIIRSDTGTSFMILHFRLKLIPEGLPRRLCNVHILRMFLDDYKDVCRIYLAANPQSQYDLVGMVGPPMNPPVATVMAFVASAPSMPSTIPSQQAVASVMDVAASTPSIPNAISSQQAATAAASSGPIIEEVSDEPAANSESASTMD